MLAWFRRFFGSNAKSLNQEHAFLQAQLVSLKTRAESSREGVRSQIETLAIELAEHNTLIKKLDPNDPEPRLSGV